MTEALLDLPGLDRALEAQRRPGSKLRLFGRLVCHSVPSSNFFSRAGPQGGFSAFQTTIGASESSPPDKRMSDTRSGGGIGQGDMYHIFAPQCQRQDSAWLRENHPPRPSSAHSPSLVEALAAVVTGIRSVNEEMEPSRPRGCLNLFGAVDEIARSSLHPQSIERRLAERRLGALAKLGGNRDSVGPEGTLESCLEPALGVGCIEFGARNADPGASTRCSCTHVRSD
jgi:hypothetical protein